MIGILLGLVATPRLRQPARRRSARSPPSPRSRPPRSPTASPTCSAAAASSPSTSSASPSAAPRRGTAASSSRFHESLAFLAQVTMFVVLGLLVFPSDLPARDGVRVRPRAAPRRRRSARVAVWASTAFSDFTPRERTFLGWAGLRGAVPIVLGTFVLSERVAHGETIFNAVFFVVLVSALLQGTTLERVAARARARRGAAAGRGQAAHGRRGEPARPDRVRRRGSDAIAGAAVRELGPAAQRPRRRDRARHSRRSRRAAAP